jgi:hypothetical protein
MKKKPKFIGYFTRYNDFIINIFEGKIMGRRPRGKPRINNFHGIREKMGCASYQQPK